MYTSKKQLRIPNAQQYIQVPLMITDLCKLESATYFKNTKDKLHLLDIKDIQYVFCMHIFPNHVKH